MLVQLVFKLMVLFIQAVINQFLQMTLHKLTPMVEMSQLLPRGLATWSDSHSTETRSLLADASGLHRSPLPLSGRSLQERSQSPDPVDSRETIADESVYVPERGMEIMALGAELFTSRVSDWEFHWLA